MRILKKSDFRGLFIHPEDMKQAIRVPCTDRYVLYRKAEEKYYEALDRRARNRQVWFWRRLALARGS